MDNKLAKNQENLERESQKRQEQPKTIPGQDLEVKQTVETIAEGVNVLSETSDESGGTFGEEEKKYQGGQLPGSGASASKSQARVTALPSVDEMIKQTVVAIELELEKTEIEMKAMMKNRKNSPYSFNDQVRKIRFLNSLLTKLKRAAKLAEEFVVSVWKQYVKKV